MRKFVLLIAMAWLVVCNINSQSLPPKKFPHPERIRYDRQCFTIEGEDVFVLSAAFHYFRVPQELWRDRFQKIKDAGFNTVETYVPWNWHERNMPRDIKDFSQCNFDDLKAWLKMAHEEFGLYTIVRPGPFICAEWAGGAYPRWLAKYCPPKYETSFWLRSNHPEHLKWARHWYDAVAPVFAAEQLTHKKPGEKGIIMVQLENEYVYFDMESGKKEEVLRALATACTSNGIDVPLFTCVTPEVRGSKDDVISQVFDMDNQYVWWNIHEAKSRIEDLKKVQPNAPAFVCELQGGWFSTVGGRLSEDAYLDERHARGMALMAMAGGSTGLNYYMFFGGTHFAGWGARNMTTSYDYGAPIKESGGVGEKYAATKGIGELVAQFGQQLVRSETIKFESSVDAEQLTQGIRQAKDGTLFLFFLNRDKKETFRDNITLKLADGTSLNIYCSLQPLDSKMLVLAHPGDQGKWYPQEQVLPARPTNLPSPIRLGKAEKCNEPFTGKWQKLGKGISLPELGVNDCRYSMYRSRVVLSKDEVTKYGSLVCEMFTGDPLYLQVNGKIAQRASADELDNTFILDGLLQAGSNELIAIYENRGHAHGYRPMEELSGLKAAGLGKKQSVIMPLENWEVKKMPDGKMDVKQELGKTDGWEQIMLDQATVANLATLQIAGLEKPKWPAAWVLQGKQGTAVYRTTIDFTPEMIKEGKTMIEFACVDDAGTLLVNGKEVASHDAWDKPFVVNLAPHIKSGKNEVAIVVRNHSGAGGLTKGVRLFSEMKIMKPLQWEVSCDLGGVVQGYCDGKPFGSQSETITLQTDGKLPRKGNNIQPKGERNALLTWYKVTFALPKKMENVWIPWRAVVNASGSGYMWLNGHNIGRHWEAGPQREFYLPECWLNFGGVNTLVLGLRQSETHGAVLQGVEIVPYYDDAEIKQDPHGNGQASAWSPDNGNGTFTNPIMWGDWPDPDIIRVGDDFYFISTSMHYVPGCPIATSKDLVNWKMAGYAVDRYDEDPRYNMEGGNLYLNGSWAATMRHHNGKFYVGFCTPYGWGREKGNFSICIADDVKGPWTRTIFPEYLYDPGLLIDDDGKVYVIHGQGTLYVTELNSDLKSVKGEKVKIWDKRFKNANELGGGFGMEGAHAYKINGKYYITCPAGGTEGWQICLRSDNIFGPYEHKLIINDNSSYPPNGLHQGGMVQLQNGDWWFIIMQDRGAIGRVPCLLPVKWVDGWPMLGADGKDAITYRKPDVGKNFPIQSPATTDEFNTSALGLQWQWNHNPDNSKWSLEERKGNMRLKASLAESLKTARNTLTQRVQGPCSEGTVEMDVTGIKDGNMAGFGIFEFPYAYVAVRQEGGSRSIVMCNNDSIVETIKGFTGNKIWIRSRVTDRDFRAIFYYSLDGINFHAIGNELQMGLGLPWTANRFALFNFSTKEEGVGGYADFNWFRFTGK